MCKGGVGVLEQPPSSLAWLEPANFELFQEFQAILPGWTLVAMARTGPKAGASPATAPKSAALQHCAITPVHSRRERRLGRVHLHHYGRISSKEILDSVSFRVTRHRASPLPLPMEQSPTPSLPVGPRLKMCDGAGNYSSADDLLPAIHPMPTKIAQAWLRWAAQAGLDSKIMAHVARAAPEPPLSPKELQKAIEILYETIGHPPPSTLEPEAEQPYRLQILATLGV